MKAFLEYVRHVNGGATLADFLEDHDPIGPRVWNDLRRAGFVVEDTEGRVRLTPAGEDALNKEP